MNLYKAEYFCNLSNVLSSGIIPFTDFDAASDAQDAIDAVYLGEIDLEEAKELIRNCIDTYDFLEDPTNLISACNYEALPNQRNSMMVMYCEDVHSDLCRQILIICADDIEEAEDIADIESWNRILDLLDAYSLMLVELDDEPENEETDGADDAED